ncbi:HGGxSTG domain-containing protein [Skermanella stibiiresistens]|uniref:HGGxSTG domain-containing protein n=1 Tax=Skermanella stibiiresistens TaxID=913326 RepID=UPI0009FBEF17
MNQPPRCNARTRRGTSCQSPMVRGKLRCRMHGGVDGVGAPQGNCNAFKHGRYSADTIAQRRVVAALLRACRDQLGEICDPRNGT